MQEKLLQFIWQHSLYNPTVLVTNSDEQVTVIHPGRYNTNAGPDFLEAKVKVGNTILAGNIELHINASDWYKHKHQDDDAYKTIILHVVYNNDLSAEKQPPNIPVISMARAISAAVLERYAGFEKHTAELPCASQLSSIRDITKEAWLNRLLAERWEEKLVSWKELLDETANDWRNLLYWRMAANFGFKVNATPFLMLARSIPLNVLAKHANNLEQIEALLFGQAGMLEGDFKDEYPNKLKTEYSYLCSKYKLTPIAAHLWKFLRLRPANFPTIRIAQFAHLITKSVHLFSQIVETHTAKEIYPLLDVQVSEYWLSHYVFDEPSETVSKKSLGKASVENIIINTIAPIQFLYASKQGTSALKEQALQLLDSVPAEKNNIITTWEGYSWKPVNAAHSQALIQLYNQYCTPRRCLDCAIGANLLKR